MKILLTGANGLLGRKLADLLAKDPDIELVATARGSLRYMLPGGTFMPMDITDEESVSQVFQKVQPDMVINTAAMTHVDQCELNKEACWAANTTAVQFLVEACARHQTHLIHVSTDFIFDGSEGPLDETAVPSPVNYYGESKLAAETIIMDSTIPWTIIRTVLVYGVIEDHSRSNIVLWVKSSLEAKKTINVVNDQWRTPTLAEDLAMGCYLAAKQQARGIYHISSEEMMTPFDIAQATARFFGLDTSLIHQTDGKHFQQPARRPPKTGFIIEKAKTELGYLPHTFEEGLAILASQLMN